MMEYIFGSSYLSRGMVILNGGKMTQGPRDRRRYVHNHAHSNNTVSSYQTCFFSKFTLLTLYVIITKCSPLSINMPSIGIESDKLCPNPLNPDVTCKSLYPDRLPPSALLSMELSLSEGGVRGLAAMPIANATASGPGLDNMPKTCTFRLKKNDKESHPPDLVEAEAALLGMQKRSRLIRFLKSCSNIIVLPTPKIVNANSKPGVSTSCVTAENPNTSGASSGASASASGSSGEVNLNIKVWGQVNWTSDGKLFFDLPAPSLPPQPSHLPPPPQQQRKAIWSTLTSTSTATHPQSSSERGYYVMVLFKVVSTTTSRVDSCELQIQQYHYFGEDLISTPVALALAVPSTSATSTMWSQELKRRLRNNFCGTIPCDQEQRLLQELKGYPVRDPILEDEEGELIFGPFGTSYERPPMTVAYFAKGLILPFLISLSASLGYLVWRRRAKAALLALAMSGEGGPAGAASGRGRRTGEEEGVLIHLDRTEEELAAEFAAKDKPPTYESLLEPPSYEQATSPVPPPLLLTHLMELEHEDELLDLDLQLAEAEGLLMKTEDSDGKECDDIKLDMDADAQDSERNPLLSMSPMRHTCDEVGNGSGTSGSIGFNFIMSSDNLLLALGDKSNSGEMLAIGPSEDNKKPKGRAELEEDSDEYLEP